MVVDRTSREDCASTFVLDGFPRTIVQAEMLEELAKAHDKEVTAILVDVPFEDLEKRLTGRRSCPVCGEIYNVFLKPPKNEGFCDFHPEAELNHRSDDHSDKVRARLETYRENTMPLLEYYENSGRLTKIDANSDPETVYSRLESVIAANNAGAS